MKINRLGIITFGLSALLAGSVQAQFSPGKLAVLRAGDNGPSQTNSASASNLGGSHQSPSFIDEFDPNTPINISTTNTGTNGPIFSVAIPTNDPAEGYPTAMWFNGHAGTEGYLSQSGDGASVSFSGYGGDILETNGTPSGLDIPRGICVIDGLGNTYLPYEGQDWYGLGAGAQTNPRGVVSDDGSNNFFGSGSLDGTEWYNPVDSEPPVTVQNLNSSRQVKIINGVFYTSLQAGDGGGAYPQGIYNLKSFGGAFPATLPEGESFFLNLAIPAAAAYPSVDGFDISPQRNVAYMADDNLGIQKYVEVGGNWTLACAFAFTNHLDTNVPSFGSFPIGYSGAFGLVVDWTQANPVIYATTTEENGSFANSNRLIKLVDNFSYTDGQLHDVSSDVVTLATAWSANVVFRGLAWAPDLAPAITTQPASQSVPVGASVSFSVAATTTFFTENGYVNPPTTYEWLVNGVQDPTQTTDSYHVASALASGTYQVIVSNTYGAVTSTVANLTVTPGTTAPSLVSPVPALALTNAVYDTITIPVTASGTTPLSFQWYQNSELLTNGGDFEGVSTSTLTVNVSSTADSGAYAVVMNNITASPASNIVANVSIVTAAPVIFVQPSDVLVASNGNADLSVAAYPLGINCSYQWYIGTPPSGTTSFGPEWSGSTSSNLVLSGALESDSGSYYVVVSNAGGAVTSAVATVTVEQPAPYSVLPYTGVGQIYLQNFNSLPDPGTSYVNNSTTVPGTPVPATIGGITYDVSNPFDFAAPIVVYTNDGATFGGLNLPKMTGWFSSDLGAEQIQATPGNSTTGLIVSFGCTNATNTINPLYPTNNRALGMISSPATEGTVGSNSDAIFALRVINLSGQTLTNFNLSYASELWRNTTTANPMTNWYYVDPLGTNSTPTNNWTGGLTNLDFSTSLGMSPGVTKVYGTNQPIAITNMAFVNVPLATAWPEGGILWIVWEMPFGASGAQGIGIDNLVFSSGPASLNIAPTNVAGVPSVTLSWPQMFTSSTLQSTSAIGLPLSSWSPVGVTPTVSEGMNFVTVPASAAAQYFSLEN